MAGDALNSHAVWSRCRFTHFGIQLRIDVVHHPHHDASGLLGLLLIGSGIDEKNASQFASADGAIVGTAMKRNGDVDAEVEIERVERIVRAFKDAGGR